MMLRSLVRTILPVLAIFVLFLPPGHSVRAAKALPTVTLAINGHKIVAEVASTPDDRATGLMNRFSLQPDRGMLFVFAHPSR